MRRLNSVDSFKRTLKSYVFTEFVNSRSLFCKYGHISYFKVVLFFYFYFGYCLLVCISFFL